VFKHLVLFKPYNYSNNYMEAKDKPNLSGAKNKIIANKTKNK